MLAVCWTSNGLPDNDSDLAILSRVPEAVEKYKILFPVLSNGKRYNTRLLKERSLLEGTQKRLIKGGKNRWAKARLKPSIELGSSKSEVRSQKLDKKKDTIFVSPSGLTDVSILVYEYYRDKVQPLSPNRGLAIKYITRIIKNYGYTAKQFTDCIDAYIASWSEDSINDQKYRCRPHNFFGPEKEVYAMYINAPKKDERPKYTHEELKAMQEEQFGHPPDPQPEGDEVLQKALQVLKNARCS